jgi:hypothetical protein
MAALVNVGDWRLRESAESIVEGLTMTVEQLQTQIRELESAREQLQVAHSMLVNIKNGLSYSTFDYYDKLLQIETVLDRCKRG